MAAKENFFYNPKTTDHDRKIDLNGPAVTKNNIPPAEEFKPITEETILPRNTDQFEDLRKGGRKAKIIPGQP